MASESDVQAIYPIAGKNGRYVIEDVNDIDLSREKSDRIYNFHKNAGCRAAKEYLSPHEILEFINCACAKTALNDLHDEEEPVFTLLKDMSSEDPPFKTGESVYEISFDLEDGKVEIIVRKQTKKALASQ